MISPGIAPPASVFSRLPRSMKHVDTPKVGLSNALPIVTGYSWEKVYVSEDFSVIDRTEGTFRVQHYSYYYVFLLRVIKRFNMPVTSLADSGSPVNGSNSYIYPNISSWAVLPLPSGISASDFVGGRKRWRITSVKTEPEDAIGVMKMEVVMVARTNPKKMETLTRIARPPEITDPIVHEVATDPDYASP